MNIKCPRCKQNKANYSYVLGVLPCDTCQEEDKHTHTKHGPEFYSLTKQERITGQRDQFAADIEQPWEPGGKPSKKFTDIYPNLATNYFNKNQLKEL